MSGPDWRKMTRGQISRLRRADLEAIYFELTMQSASCPATKAGLLEEIGEILQRESRRAWAAQRPADRDKRWRDLQAHLEASAAQAARTNAIFDTMPPVPLWGEQPEQGR